MASPALIVAAILVCITLSHAQDPTCATGIRAGGVCCAASCKQCGGAGCGRFPGGGAKCCRGKVLESGKSCATSNPPCLVGAPATKPPTTGVPTTTVKTPPKGGGKASWKNIDATIKGRPRARHEACFVMAKGKGYLIGGRGRNRGMDIFDAKTRTWTKGPDPPTMMHHMQCVVVGAKIFIPTSWFSFKPEKENPRMYVYNTVSKKWSSRQTLPPNRRRGGAASVLVGNRIYVVGGARGGHGPPAKTLGWMDYYDLKTKKWVTGLKDLPDPRDHVGGALVKGQLCIAGGRNGGAPQFFKATKKSVYCYDFKLDKWIRKPDIPTPRAGAATDRMCDGRMMVAGGEGKFKQAFDKVEIFDGNKWTTGPSLKRGRHGTSFGVASNCNCGQIFIASGSGSRGGGPELTETEVYLPNGKDKICQKY